MIVRFFPIGRTCENLHNQESPRVPEKSYPWLTLCCPRNGSLGRRQAPQPCFYVETSQIYSERGISKVFCGKMVEFEK